MSPSRAQQRVYRPSEKFLQQLNRLERSSPDFPIQLANLFGEKAWNFSESLQPGDVEWLIEYLDDVIGSLDPVDRAYRECLDQLGWACRFAEKLPQSQTLDVTSLVPIPNPIPIGPYEACYEGSLNNSKVCVKKFNPILARKRNLGVRTYHFCKVFQLKYLRHSNIVPFLGVINEPIQFVSALVPGRSVTTYIASAQDTLDPLSLLIGIASGLEYLHSRDVAHRDLGGPHIIIDDSGRPRITNFDLGAVFLTHELDEVRACKRWSSPEALRGGTSEYWVSTDIFSFAMVIVEVFTGQIPFFPETDSMAQSAILDGKRPVRPTHPDLTDRLWALAERCWDGYSHNRPRMSEVVQVLRNCRRKSMRKDARTARLSRSSKTTTRNSTLSENEPLDMGDTPREDGSGPSGDENTPTLPSAQQPAPGDWFSQITDEILDLTDQVASVALFGPIGVGKSFIARATLDNDRTRATFGDNCYFICCDDLENSPDSFIQRLSEAIHVDVAQLRSRLETSPALIFVLDGVDPFLDPAVPGAEEIHALIEELGSYEHVCLVTTSRMYPDIPGFHRINIQAPPEDGARGIFYNLCDLGRSSAVDNLIARLDSHPLSIKLLAGAICENNWDEATLLKVWDDQTSVLRENYYQKLKDAVEPIFHSPTIKNLGDLARDVLGAIAAFPSGIGEHQLRGIFHATGGVGEVVDALCKFSLVSRRDGLVRMPSPFRFYFLESMLVVGEAGEDVKWGPDCMPAKAWLPIYTQGPPEGWTSDVVSRPTLRRDANDAFPRATPVFTSGPPGSGPSHTTSRYGVPTRKMWIRRLPKRIKQRLLAFFGRRIKTTILAELCEGPANIPPIATPEDPTNMPSVPPREGPASTPPIATQVDPTRVPPVALQEDPTNIPSTTPHEDEENTPPASPQDDPEIIQPTVPQSQTPPMPGAYDVDW